MCIFSRKWNYRYSKPQSYIDYFTQQVWNGNIEEAKKAGDDAEAYLRSIEGAQSVAPSVAKINNFIEETIGIDLRFSSFNAKITDMLDKLNKLVIKK